ncbi:MAG: DsbA family protein [Candidatus Colwellbacteria bacterium]|nr:DsbA family protein [Candidatus Colwellbacteria bacterium]
MEQEYQEKKSNSYFLPVSIIIAGAFIASAIYFGGGSSSSQNANVIAGLVDTKDWPVVGVADAPVTIIEYADFTCPYCTRFALEIMPLIKRDYIDTGKVRLVYKDFIAVGGQKAAEAAHCAVEQGKFWQYHDLLFERNAEDRGSWHGVEVHRDYAETLGLDVGALVECFQSGRYQEKVETSTKEARAFGATGTPFFIVNNRPILGAQPYVVFQEAIEFALSN